jgi:hypothetical protein
MRQLWREAWADRGWRIALLAGVIIALPVVLVLPYFFGIIESKPGYFLNDPVLRSIGPIEASAYTFGVLYSLVIGGIIGLTRDPYRLVQMLHAYVFLLLLRMVTMYTITLEAPLSIIPLIDPVTQNFYPAEEPFLKDLFFSGHTSTAVLFAIAVGRSMLRKMIGLGAVIVGFLVILQHVHYTIDVLAAPFFATVAWYAAKWTIKLCGTRKQLGLV